MDLFGEVETMVIQRIVGLGAVSLGVVGLLAIDLAVAIEHFMVPYAHSLPVPIVLRPFIYYSMDFIPPLSSISS